MATTRKKVGLSRKSTPKAGSAEARELQLANLAYDAVEKRIQNGEATSAELVHFLKVGSPEYQLKLINLREEAKLKQARAEELQSRRNVEELYANALTAMRAYQGVPEDEDEEL